MFYSNNPYGLFIFSLRRFFMKRKVIGLIVFFTFCSLIVLGCGVSTEDLAKQVKASIEETYKEKGLNIKIEDFTLVKKSKKEYRGILKISGYGEKQTVAVNVTVDGENLIWEIEQ
jgi:hypothetical protein